MSESMKAAAASYGRSFMAAALAAFWATGGDVFALDMESLRIVIGAGVAAVVPVVLRALNSSDHAFGKGVE
jgi:glucose dehydrogenase